jgi:hypothetical protein
MSVQGYTRRSRTALYKSGLPMTADIPDLSIFFGSGQQQALRKLRGHRIVDIVPRQTRQARADYKTWKSGERSRARVMIAIRPFTPQPPDRSLGHAGARRDRPARHCASRWTALDPATSASRAEGCKRHQAGAARHRRWSSAGPLTRNDIARDAEQWRSLCA